MAESTTDLNKAVMERLRKQILEEEARQRAQAMGTSVARGVSGGSFEGRQLSRIGQDTSNRLSDAALNLELQDAQTAREDAIRKADMEFQSLEAEKQRAFQSGQNDLAFQFQERQNELMRQANESQSRREGKQDLLNTGIGAGANILGGLVGRSGLFGGGAPPAAGLGRVGSLFGSTGARGGLGVPTAPANYFSGGAGGGAGGLFGGIGAGPLALGAATMGAGMAAGQYLGKGLYKSDEARTAARKGAQIGSFVPVVGPVLGGALGGLQPTVKKTIKKVFCFDASTLVEMGDGSLMSVALVEPGDVTAGGIVYSVRKSITEPGTRYNYKGVIVTGYHAVLENGKWIRVHQSKEAKPVSGAGMVYSLVTDSHRIYVNGITFADEHETDAYEELGLEASLAVLNMVEQHG